MIVSGTPWSSAPQLPLPGKGPLTAPCLQPAKGPDCLTHLINMLVEMSILWKGTGHCDPMVDFTTVQKNPRFSKKGQDSTRRASQPLITHPTCASPVRCVAWHGGLTWGQWWLCALNSYLVSSFLTLDLVSAIWRKCSFYLSYVISSFGS